MSRLRKRRWLALCVAVLAAAFPMIVLAQTIPGSPFAGAGGSGTSLPVADTQTIVQGSADPTKLLRFEVDGFTTGTTRVVTVPNSDLTIAGLAVSNVFTGTNFFSTTNTGVVLGGNSATNNRLTLATASTPDTGLLGVGTLSNSWLIAELADATFDFAHAATTNPTLFIHSTNQSTTEFAAYTHLGSAPNQVTVTVDGATTFAITTGYVILACTGAETINTITGGLTGAVLYLVNNDTDCTLADDDTATAANALNLTGAATNDTGAAGKHITLIFDGNAWQQLSESANN